MKPDTALAAACGLNCNYCEHRGDKCRGCGHVAGKPFWAEEYQVAVCPIYGCCVGEKKLDHCGLCEVFPCETFQSLRDPSLSDEEAEKALWARQSYLIRRREIGTEAWLEGELEVKPDA